MFTALLFSASLLILAWLTFGAAFQFVGAIAGYFYRNAAPEMRGIADAAPVIRIFIPAFREDAIIENTVRETLLSDYPPARFEVVVIADGLRPETIARLQQMDARVLEVQFNQSTKAKALNSAIQTLEKEENGHGLHPQVAIVLDADNVPARDFLKRIAAHFSAGTKAIQGRRVAKNMDTPFAMLDAASEDVNNHILCRGARVFGWSARLAGSGMAFGYGLFAETMRAIDAVGGFDKALEGHLTRRGICIEYDQKALVFDEKVSRPDAFSRQRSRWIVAQFQHFRQFFPEALRLLLHNGNFDFFQKTVQMALPPRLLSPGFLLAGTVFHTFFHTGQSWFWGFALAMNLSAFALALPAYLFEKRNLRVWLHLPRVFFATLYALTGLRKAGKVFVVTPKGI